VIITLLALKNSKSVFILTSALLLSTLGNSIAQNTSALNTLKKTAPTDITIDFPTPTPKFSYSPIKNKTGLSGESLFQYLHQTTKPSKAPTTKGYTSSRAYMYSIADNVTCNGRPGIMTFYSLVCANGTSGTGADYNEIGDGNGDGTYNDEINAEHIWPQSYFGKQNPMLSDIHHLRPTFTRPNSMRSRYPFGEVTSWDYTTSAGSRRGHNEFEPGNAMKGDVARSMLYFMVRYYDKNIRGSMDYTNFWINRVEMFLRWNRQDPPTMQEMRRNDLIEKFQGNRNPFTDDYTLADKIGARVFQSH
jgi:Endonuclease I